VTPEEELDARFLSAVRSLPDAGQATPADPAAPVADGTTFSLDGWK
jgi:hypothetical protein